MAALPPTIRHILETQMIEGYKYQSEFAQRYYGAGEAAGIEKGRVEGLRKAVVELMRSKLDAPAQGDVIALEAMPDEDALTELLRSLVNAGDAVEARAVLDRALGAARLQR